MSDIVTSKAASNGAANPVTVFRDNLKAMRSEIAHALPPQVDADRFIRTIMTSVQMQPELLNKDRRSLFAACMKSAQTGLFPDGQDAAFVAFGSNVQFMPMVAGLLRLARQSGEILSISAHCVYANDYWEYSLGDDERIVHRPLLEGDRGAIIAAYAIGKTRGGGVFRDVMSMADIEKVRSVSRAKNGGPWAQWFDRMAEKTVLRRLLKRMPCSTDLAVSLEADNETYDLSQTPASPQPRAKLDPTAALRMMVGEPVAPKGPEPELEVPQIEEPSDVQ